MPYHIEIPDFGSLSPEQRRAVRHQGSVRLKGGPGTGKSLVSLWRALAEQSGKEVLILTYTLSLEFYFHQMLESAQRRGNNKEIHIRRSQKSYYNKEEMLSGFYSEIILDEAQDMTHNEIIYFSQIAERISFGADYKQQLYPNKGVEEKLLENRLRPSRTFEMNRNYRSTKQILKAVRAFYPNRGMPADVINRSKDGALVEIIVSDFKEEAALTFKLLQKWLKKTDGNIGVLVPSKKKVNEIFSTIERLLPNDTSKYTSDDQQNELKYMGRVHVSSYKSSKGLEWDVIILPFFGSREWFSENTQVQDNDHYVAMTRAKNQLILVTTSHSDITILESAYQSTPTKPFTVPPSFTTGDFMEEDDDLPF